MNDEIRQQRAFVLRALRRMQGIPMPNTTLVASVQTGFPAQTPSQAEVSALLADMEADGYLVAVNDDIAGRVWTLTMKGTAKALQLP